MGTNLITEEGFNKLQHELSYLWKEYRPQITEKVAWAASLGDRSENADYKENKRLLRQIDSRIRYIRKRLELVRIVKYSSEQEGRVYFGAWVEVVQCGSERIKKSFRIVGPDEIYGKSSMISIDSPMARALLGRQEGDIVTVSTAENAHDWKILQVGYKSSANLGFYPVSTDGLKRL